MVKVYIDADERYPDFDLSTEPLSRYEMPTGELTEKEFEDWQRVRREYNVWTERISAMERAYWAKKREDNNG